MSTVLQRRKNIDIITLTTNLFNQVKDSVKDDFLNSITLDYTPADSSITEFNVFYGRYAPVHKDDGTFFFNVNPISNDYRKLFIYYNGVGYTFPTLDAYFEYDPSSGGVATLTETVQNYIDVKVQEVQATVVPNDSVAPVNNFTELSNVVVLTDQRVIYVDQANALFVYDATSSEAVDGTTVLPSSTGVGRWKQVNDVINGGSF